MRGRVAHGEEGDAEGDGAAEGGGSRADQAERELSRGVIYAPTTAKANESHILTLCQDGRRGREGAEAERGTQRRLTKASCKPQSSERTLKEI